jgi:O-antigen/teichoic acid export membrane protein
MSVASELHTSLRSMGFMQLLLAIVFLTAYSIACSTLFGGRGRARASVVALLAAVAFTALTTPWVHGVLMVTGAVAGLGVFAALAWVSSAALNVAGIKALEESSAAAPVSDPAAEPIAVPAPASPPARAPQPTRIPAA